MDNPKPLGKFETGSKAALPIFEEFVKKVKKSDARPFKVSKRYDINGCRSNYWSIKLNLIQKIQ